MAKQTDTWQMVTLRSYRAMSMLQAESRSEPELSGAQLAERLISEGIQRRREMEAAGKRPVTAARQPAPSGGK